MGKKPRPLSPSALKVLAYLRKTPERWISPTEIGKALWGGHSAWASPKCLILVSRGLAKRSSLGAYQATPWKD